MILTFVRSHAATAAIALTLFAPAANAPRGQPGLQIQQFVADTMAFGVNAVLISGQTEAILIDGHYHVADARRVADAIATSGKRLKALFITHPDHDHYASAATFVERFPGTPVYMTAAAHAEYTRTAKADFERDRSRAPQLFPDSIVSPTVLPSTTMTVDGHAVEVIPDLQGDVLVPTSSIVWIPSLRTVITGDVLFNGVHPWLAMTNAAARQAWQASLRRMQELRPAVVIAGHKSTPNAPDTPATIDAMKHYLTDFESALSSSPDPAALVSSMKQKYADWKVEILLRYTAQYMYRR